MAIKMTKELRKKRDEAIEADRRGGLSYRELAAKYNLNVKTIYEILRRQAGNAYVKKKFRK